MEFLIFLLFTDEKGKFDEMVEDKGVKILIDPKALLHVIGTRMDFVDDKLRYKIVSAFVADESDLKACSFITVSFRFLFVIYCMAYVFLLFFFSAFFFSAPEEMKRRKSS